ncbi:MAG: gamma-glutamyltransferase, partial [Planctomycetales bacterium]|nr:gamma-glutamyltransferase [Planctomycetales bacterium]
MDAAVAAAFASFVAEAALVNIGGGGMAMIVGGDGAGEATVYDFFSTMPSGHLDEDADFREILVDFGPEQQPFYIGRASTAVPGVVAGLCAMAQAQ